MTNPKPTGKYRRKLEAKPDAEVKASPEHDLAAAVKARRPPSPEPETPLYGRRKAGHVQVNVTLPPDLRRRLRRYAEDHDLTMSEVVEVLVARHVPEG